MRHLLLLMLVALAGCKDSGRVVSGTFTVDGKPKSGVQVFLTNDLGDFSTCGDARPVSTTNAAGEFSARASKFPIRPCFLVDGVTYSTFVIIDDHTQDPIHLSCKLPLVMTGHFEDGNICY